MLIGGDGNDVINGGRGNDTAQLGTGDDTFVWNPGDGSDMVDGGDGRDTLQFNGSNVSEKINISANGSPRAADARCRATSPWISTPWSRSTSWRWAVPTPSRSAI